MFAEMLTEQTPKVKGTTIIRKWKLDMDNYNEIPDEELDQIMRDLEDIPDDELEYLGDEEIDDEEIDDDEDFDDEDDDDGLKDYL